MVSESTERPWLRLHPLSVVVNLLPRLFASARSLWPLLLAWVWGRATGVAVVDLLLLSLFLVPSVGGTVLHWATLRYRLTGDQLELTSGLLMRSHRSIAVDRIQNVEVVRNLFHRLAGLAEVRVETASGSEVEGLLSALSLADADALVAALRRHPTPEPSTAAVAGELLAAPTLAELALAGATGLRLATLGVAFGFALQLLRERPGGEADVGAATQGASAVEKVALVALVATGGVFVAMGNTLLRHAGFRLESNGDRLSVQEGLFTRRRTELQRDRLQIAIFEQGAVHRWLGFGALTLETAAARRDGDGTERASTRVPAVQASHVGALIRGVLPTATDPDTLMLRSPHPSAGWRGASVAGLLSLMAAGVVLWVAGRNGAVAFALVPMAAGFGWLRAAQQRWVVTDDLVVTRTGWPAHRTAVVPRPKIQSVSTTATPMLRRAGLSRLTVRIAGRALVLPLMEHEEAAALLVRLSKPTG